MNEKRCQTCAWWAAVVEPWGACGNDEVIETDTRADYDWCKLHQPRDMKGANDERD